MVEITSTSKHGKTKSGTACANGSILGTTTLGHAQYTIAFGKGSKRKSETRHCSPVAIQNYKEQLQSQGY